MDESNLLLRVDIVTDDNGVVTSLTRYTAPFVQMLALPDAEELVQKVNELIADVRVSASHD